MLHWVCNRNKSEKQQASQAEEAIGDSTEADCQSARVQLRMAEGTPIMVTGKSGLC